MIKFLSFFNHSSSFLNIFSFCQIINDLISFFVNSFLSVLFCDFNLLHCILNNFFFVLGRHFLYHINLLSVQFLSYLLWILNSIQKNIVLSIYCSISIFLELTCLILLKLLGLILQIIQKTIFTFFLIIFLPSFLFLGRWICSQRLLNWSFFCWKSSTKKLFDKFIKILGTF